MIYILSLVLIALLILNLVASYVVFKTHFIVKNRRIYQLIFIWLVPIIGAAFAIYLNREDYFYKKPKKQIGNETNMTDHSTFGIEHRGGRGGS